jgi:O-antigen/teichoic acid export membrane protein
MKKNRDSVAKGGSSVALARMVGMAFSFLLFLILARHSAVHAGTFKTVMTYIVIAEFLGMLGLHRWLATEMATEIHVRWSIFWATNTFTLGVSSVLFAVYIVIAMANIYSIEINEGILLGALAVIPSGIYACVQSALLGLGKSHFLGKLNMAENLIRCSISIVLVHFDQPVTWIILVFVITRWCVALYGFFYLKRCLNGESWHLDQTIFKKIVHEAPKFATIIAAFLLLRNAGLLILPAVTNVAEAATFAVGYQLFDLILIIPSVLALTSIHVFSDKATASSASLKKASIQLVSITSLALFPLIAITAAFAQYFILFLYGDKYLHGQFSLMFLMFASGFTMIDMVLSQIMQARKDYRNDMISVIVAGLTAAVLTVVLSFYFGAAGAALALMLAVLVNVIVRLHMLKTVFPFKLLALSLWKQTLASAFVFLICTFSLKLEALHLIRESRYLWMLCIPVALILYGVLIYYLGGLSQAQRNRMRQFLFHH